MSGRRLELEPIGVLRSPFRDRADAPRQPRAALGVEGTIVLEPGRGFEDALSDLEGWQYVWVIGWFDRNTTWRPKVTPPRSTEKRGVFSTRAPHRPNPIALSVFELVSVSGLELRVRNVDLLDGTPILDIKPYVPWTDAIVDAKTGWLGVEGSTVVDTGRSFEVRIEPRAMQTLELLASSGIHLEPALRTSLELGPSPHAYRRIKRVGDRYVLAIKDWRARFRVEEKLVIVEAIRSGYRATELGRPDLELHRIVEASYAGE